MQRSVNPRNKTTKIRQLKVRRKSAKYSCLTRRIQKWSCDEISSDYTLNVNVVKLFLGGYFMYPHYQL
jgi:hypothetical protein